MMNFVPPGLEDEQPLSAVPYQCCGIDFHDLHELSKHKEQHIKAVNNINISASPVSADSSSQADFLRPHAPHRISHSMNQRPISVSPTAVRSVNPSAVTFRQPSSSLPPSTLSRPSFPTSSIAANHSSGFVAPNALSGSVNNLRGHIPGVSSYQSLHDPPQTVPSNQYLLASYPNSFGSSHSFRTGVKRFSGPMAPGMLLDPGSKHPRLESYTPLTPPDSIPSSPTIEAKAAAAAAAAVAAAAAAANGGTSISPLEASSVVMRSPLHSRTSRPSQPSSLPPPPPPTNNNSSDEITANEVDQQPESSGSSSPGGENGSADRTYRCTHPECGKTYKNANGLKYHLQYGHSEDANVEKRHRCAFPGCGKTYKNANGLKYHISHSHALDSTSNIEYSFEAL